MPRPRSWTDEQFADAVAASRTLSEVCQRLDIRPGGYDMLRVHIARLGIDASHLPRASAASPQTRHRWTEADLAYAVGLSDSVSEVSRRLGYMPSGGVHRMIISRIRTSGLDTSHFTRVRWTQDRTFPQRSIPLDEILVVDSTYRSTSTLRRRLVAAGLLSPACAVCGLADWRGKTLPLHLDHINGDHTDNRLENLRILCPNCHSQTLTWCGGNRRRSPTGRRPSN